MVLTDAIVRGAYHMRAERYLEEIMTALVLERRPSIRSMVRICSGGCEHFNPIYVDGRKVAGAGRCDLNEREDAVRVGSPCLWPGMRTTAGVAIVA
jgi:hypothetical protein